MPRRRCRIKMFFHCRHCMAEKPAGESPASWARISVGWTENSLQVWCQRHDIEITDIKAEEVRTNGQA